MKHYVGIDLGGTNVRVAVVAEDGHIIKQRQCPSCAKEGPIKVTAVIFRLLEELGDFSDCESIGIAVPGPVDKKRKVMTLATNLPGFVDYPLATFLEEKTHLPVVIDNDANAAGLAEALVGAGKGKDSVYYITHSTGIGGAFIFHGESIGGRKGYAGEIANIIVDRHLPKINHLAPGAAENVASGTALKRKAIEEFGLTDAGALFALSERDEKAHEVIRSMAYDMAQLLASIAHVVDPDIFVIGGGVAFHSHSYYFEYVRRFYRDLVHPDMGDVDIVLAELQEPGIIGAALMARGKER